MEAGIRRSAVFRICDDGGQRLFSEELLFKPLIQWLADELSESGVDELLLVTDEENGIGCDFSRFSVCRQTDLKGIREALKELVSEGDRQIITVAGTVFFDRDVISELITTLGSRSKVMLTSGGSPLGVCGFSGEDASDGILIEGALIDLGAHEGFYELDCLDTGILGLEIRSLEDICRAEELLRDTINRKHMANGVRFIGAETSFISPDVDIGGGSVIYPNTIIRGKSSIGRNCKIGPNTVIDSCIIDDMTEVNSSQLKESKIGENAKVGPFAYIRPGCIVGNDVRIGDFVELKKANIGDATKISHLTYIGDAEVGKAVNIGCGTVTANYDGKNKHVTIIEDGAFIGCNTNLVAPVRVGKNATVAAGTTITADVPGESLAIGRVRQSIKPDWYKRTRK
jgi:bifunctional UDP-N-acetylglucosamine pyrophosphorylase/glucosamine-1-phosphate N-acetyltransferase